MFQVERFKVDQVVIFDEFMLPLMKNDEDDVKWLNWILERKNKHLLKSEIV